VQYFDERGLSGLTALEGNPHVPHAVPAWHQTISGSRNLPRAAASMLVPAASGNTSGAPYVDNVPTQLQAQCSSQTDSAEGYSCSAPLPRLTPGRHVIELVSILELESARSTPLVVDMIGGSSVETTGRPVRVE
jgi:hypothetical protein